MDDKSTQTTPITLFLTDDHQAVIEGLIALLAQDSSLCVVGHCNDGEETIKKVPQLQPDVLVLDISMPGMNGLEVCQVVKSAAPKVRVVMLTMHHSEKLIADALRRGASGYVAKEAVEEICQAVRHVHSGGIYLGRGIHSSAPGTPELAAAWGSVGAANHLGGDL